MKAEEVPDWADLFQSQFVQELIERLTATGWLPKTLEAFTERATLLSNSEAELVRKELCTLGFVIASGGKEAKQVLLQIGEIYTALSKKGTAIEVSKKTRDFLGIP